MGTAIDPRISTPAQLQRTQNISTPRKEIPVERAPERDNKVVNIRIKTFDPYKLSYQAINPKLRGDYLTFMEKGRNDEYKYVIINTKICREIRSSKPI
jgi:hypothetical protein